jgi:agmatine deiminase
MATVVKETQSPKELGYSFPDEWEPRAGTMMIFPAKNQYGKFQIDGLRSEFCTIAKAIANNEPVHVFCIPQDASTCHGLFGDNENIFLHVGQFTLDWARDNAPILLRNNKSGKLASAGFQCNGWGKKYKEWKADIHTRDNMAASMNWPVFPSEMVLEGGAIEICNGVGITTESCTLNKNRTKLPKAKVERELKDMLGLDTIIWLQSGLVPDPFTDGHVDGMVKWISKDTVMLHTIEDEYQSEDPKNYAICQQAKTVLRSHKIHVVELPLAEKIVHMNFYIGSGGTIAYVPVCGDPKHDDPALEVLCQHFETVVPIVANHIYKAGGGIHCYTQQIPASWDC